MILLQSFAEMAVPGGLFLFLHLSEYLKIYLWTSE